MAAAGTRLIKSSPLEITGIADEELVAVARNKSLLTLSEGLLNVIAV